MNTATMALDITSLSVFGVFMGLLIWGFATGQFRNIEDAKYRMMELDDIGSENKDGDDLEEDEMQVNKTEKKGEDENARID